MLGFTLGKTAVEKMEMSPVPIKDVSVNKKHV